MTTPNLSREYEDLFRLADAVGWALRPSDPVLDDVYTLHWRESEDDGNAWEWRLDGDGMHDCGHREARRACRLSVIEGLRGWLLDYDDGPDSEFGQHDKLARHVERVLSHGGSDEAYIALARRILEAKGVKA